MNRAAFPLRHTQAGLTLIELMIAMVLGALLIGGVGSIVIASGQTNRANQALAQIQENSRTAFELLARDIRQAGATGCGNLADRVFISDEIDDAVASVVWTGIRGYAGGTVAPGVTTGTATNNRIAGTHAILTQGIAGGGFLIVDVDSETEEDAGVIISEERSYEFQAPANAVENGDLLLACNSDQAVVFEASEKKTDDGTVTVKDTSGTSYTVLAERGMVATLNSTVWYVGNNGRPEEGGRSLYRLRAGEAPEEVIPGISDMQIEYRVGNDANFVAAPANWEEVTAVEITLTAQSLDDRGGREGGRIERSFTSLIGLRNIRI